eukprot:875-Prymnesium_polylepis.1
MLTPQDRCVVAFQSAFEQHARPAAPPGWRALAHTARHRATEVRAQRNCYLTVDVGRPLLQVGRRHVHNLLEVEHVPRAAR